MVHSKTPTGRASIVFAPAFSGTGGDLDHEGPTRTAWATDTYGLVIHTSVISNAAPAWTIAHTRSGYAVTYATTWQAALDTARRLGACGSWNRDRDVIEADKAFCAAAAAVITDHGGARYRRPAGSVWG